MEMYDGYDSSPAPAAKPAPKYSAYVSEFLADDTVPRALKTLFLEVLPEKDLAQFKKMVANGALRHDMKCESFPLAAPCNQIVGMLPAAEAGAWLKIILAPCADVAALPSVLQIYTGSQYTYRLDQAARTTNPPSVTPLASYLVNNAKLDCPQLAAIHTHLLVQNIRYTVPNTSTVIEQPAIFATLQAGTLNVELLEKIEAVTGDADFLRLRDTAGRTLLMHIASTNGYRENQQTIDALSWMIMRDETLVNVQDKLGWTPLDRFITVLSRTSDKPYNNTTTRLLIAAGAQFNRQIAPDFNMSAEVEKRNMPFLYKSDNTKKALLPAPPKA